MDYLKGHNTASALAIIVIGRYLATRAVGVSEDEMESSLQLPDSSGPSAALEASLAVGRDLAFFVAEGRRKADRVWTLSADMRATFEGASMVDSLPSRIMVLRQVAKRALDAVDERDTPSDLALALTWLQLRDPLAPFATQWSDGPEKAFENAGMRNAVDTPEQWRAVMRWAKSLGLAADTRARGKTYFTVDPTPAVGHVLPQLPRHGPARRWLDELQTLLPVLGDPQLISQLPAGTPRDGVPSAVVLAMLKLERLGRLKLVASDDASDVVVLSLGGVPRQIGEVHVVDGAQ